MNLLFTRSQMSSSLFSIIPPRIGGVVTFKLKAEAEFTDEENALIKKYSFDKAVLVESNPFEDLQRAFRPALLLALTVAFLIIWLVPASRGFEGTLQKAYAVLSVGAFTLVTMMVIYYFHLKKSITLADLRNGGRTFYCHSVVELDDQEKELLDLNKRLHATLEKARDWGGREINPIPIGEPFYLPPDENTHHRSPGEHWLFKAGTNVKKSADKLKEVVETAPDKMRAEFGNPRQPNASAPPSNPTQPTQAAPPPQTPPTQPGNQQQPNQPNPNHPFSPKPPNNPNDVDGGEFG